MKTIKPILGLTTAVIGLFLLAKKTRHSAHQSNRVYKPDSLAHHHWLS